MQTTKASNRYAQALFDIATENGSVNDVLGDLKMIAETFNKEPDLVRLVKNPTIKKNTKEIIFENIFATKTHRITMNFLSLVVAKNREVYLLDIIRKYATLYHHYNKITVAQVISAEPLSESIKNNIKQKISATGKVQLEEKIDKSLLGGFIIKTGDLQYDASIRKKINNAKRAFKL